MTMTVTTSHVPIAARVPLPFPHSLTVAEYAFPFFRIVEFDESNGAKRNELYEKLIRWATPDLSLSEQLLDDYQNQRTAVQKYLSESLRKPTSANKIVTLTTDAGLHCILTYNESDWHITHLVSTLIYRGAGTAAMNYVIDTASINHVAVIQLYWLTSSQPFYRKFGFEDHPTDYFRLIKALK